jgi:pimeloyl-ACP methyl ester carboxylesterase
MNLPIERRIQLGELHLYAREWLPSQEAGDKPAFLLYHGLSSNAATWDMVAADLAHAGYHVFAVDQRGHGLSDKPDDGYDFATVARDVYNVVEFLKLENVVLAGQSWGGNVLLEVAARFPGLAVGYIFVDGGFLNLHQRGSWESVSVELRPPDLTGIPIDEIKSMIRSMQPGWTAEAVNGSAKNFEVLPDGTVRPWLSLDHHMAILRALYNQDVPSLFPKVQEPVLICAADDGHEWSSRKREQVAAAQENIPEVSVRWFADTAHDIHVDKPHELSALMQDFAVNHLSHSGTN